MKESKPIDIIRTMAIIAGHFWYYHTAWRDVNQYDNFGIVLFGQILLSVALIASIMDNLGLAPRIIPKSWRDALSDWFDKIQGR